MYYIARPAAYVEEAVVVIDLACFEEDVARYLGVTNVCVKLNVASGNNVDVGDRNRKI